MMAVRTVSAAIREPAPHLALRLGHVVSNRKTANPRSFSSGRN